VITVWFGAAADVVERDVMVGLIEEFVLRQILADDRQHGAQARRLAAVHEVHHTREVRFGLILEGACGGENSAACGGRDARGIAELAGHRHRGHAGLLGDGLEADAGGRFGHGVSITRRSCCLVNPPHGT